MKKIFFTLLSLFLSLGLFAQHLSGDPMVRKGKLENGLTYYIRHNELPAQRAEFYLATNVGAIQETPEQDGLAHFLEHMCFNGTKNFPGKSILDYLQSIGASFGGNVNASTGVEETVYMLNNIPLVNGSVVDSCLLILHDYSHFVTCDPAEIDKERGVIIEEKRSRNDFSWRMMEKAQPYIYGDSKYASCTIIGSQENLESFSPSCLTDFYRTWYRPDLQAVVVVGDIDVDAVEAKIVSTWSDVPAAENPKAKEKIYVKENAEPVIGILSDPELPSTNFSIMWKKTKTDSEENNDTASKKVKDLVENIISHAMQERFSEKETIPDSPITGGAFYCGGVCETLESVNMAVSVKEGRWKDALELAMTEAEKLRRFGLTEGEIQRAEEAILANSESAAKRSDTRKNPEFVGSLIGNFFDNNEYMTPEKRHAFYKSVIPQISKSMIDKAAAGMITDDNLVVLYYAPEKEGVEIPSEEQISSVISNVRNSEIKADEEKTLPANFVDPETLAGSTVKKQKKTILGADEYQLSNGLTLVLMPMDYEKDNVILRIFKKGGISRIPTEDLGSFAGDIWSTFQYNQGVSSFSAVDMRKMLSGKRVSVQPYLAQYCHGVFANSSSKDVETALQLMYLHFCDPRFDTAEFDQTIQMLESVIGNLDKMPQWQFYKKSFEVMYDDDRHPFLDEALLKEASLETMERNYKALFNDAAGAVAIIAGDFSEEEVLPLALKYFGSIKKGKKPLKIIERHEGLVDGNRVEDFSVPMETPMVTVEQCYKINAPFTAKREVAFDALEYILRMIYTDTMREDEGGTYGTQVSTDVGFAPLNEDKLEIAFNTNSELADKLREMATKAVTDMAADGPSEEQFDKALKNLQKKLPESKIRNSYWYSGLEFFYLYDGIDYLKDYEDAVNSLTADDVKAAAAALVSSGNFIELVMRPTPKEE